MEDLIRRSDAVAILEDLQKDHLQFCLIPFRQAIERVQAIPSAESTGDLDNAIYEYVQDGLMSNPYDRPQGEWIEEEYKGRIYGIYRCQYKCFHCGYVPMHRVEPIIPTNRTLRFCPNCGARMFAKDTNVPNKKGADDERVR